MCTYTRLQKERDGVHMLVRERYENYRFAVRGNYVVGKFNFAAAACVYFSGYLIDDT